MGLNGLPKSDVLKYFFDGEQEHGSVVIRPSGTEPKLKAYISVTASEKAAAEKVEAAIKADLEKKLKRYEKKIENFKGTLSCEVTDICRSLLPEEEGAYIVIFDGCIPAAGSIWTIDECTVRL